MRQITEKLYFFFCKVFLILSVFLNCFHFCVPGLYWTTTLSPCFMLMHPSKKVLGPVSKQRTLICHLTHQSHSFICSFKTAFKNKYKLNHIQQRIKMLCYSSNPWCRIIAGGCHHLFRVKYLLCKIYKLCLNKKKEYIQC